MSLTIQEIENQIAELQKTLEKLKNPKLEIFRNFTGQYFAPYKECQYRRMESNGIAIWESFLESKKEWVPLDKQQFKELEEIYVRDCIFATEETSK